MDRQHGHLRIVADSHDNPRRELAPPSPPPVPGRGARSLDQEGLSEVGLAYLLARGISEETACAAGVGCRTLSFRGETGPDLRECLVFPYRTGGKVYAQKVRTLSEKAFTQVGSASTFWLQDQVRGGSDLIIVEGEMDALALREVGHNDVVSVPNGAPVKVSNSPVNAEADRKFQYVWQGREILKAANRVIIAVDNDEPGHALGEEIARRWGKAKCWKISWPEDAKDANEVLLKYGQDRLKEIIANPEPWPVAGVYNAKHFSSELRALYDGGLGKGADPGMGTGELYTLCPGNLTVVTGIPGSGKSSVFNQIMVNMAAMHGWRSAIYSSETPPSVHISILASMQMGKPFFHGPTPRMTERDLGIAEDWIEDHFTFLHFEETPTYQEIIERLEVAVLRSGIRLFVVDPCNYLRKTNEDGIEWVGEMLEAFRSFAQSHGCHAIVIAHPKKPADYGDRIPEGYDISGSAAWFNRADFGISIHRPKDNRQITKFVVWKVRWSWTGSEGTTELFYDPPTGRFSDYPFNNQARYEPVDTADPWALAEMA
jgi:twinkle protein